LRGLSGSGFDNQFWQTDAVNPGILGESPHPLSIVGVQDEFLNNDLKQAMARHRTLPNKAALKSNLTSYTKSR